MPIQIVWYIRQRTNLNLHKGCQSWSQKGRRSFEEDTNYFREYKSKFHFILKFESSSISPPFSMFTSPAKPLYVDDVVSCALPVLALLKDRITKYSSPQRNNKIMNNSTGSNNHLRYIDIFRSMIILNNRSKVVMTSPPLPRRAPPPLSFEVDLDFFVSFCLLYVGFVFLSCSQNIVRIK